jgi:hypothetical protein
MLTIYPGLCLLFQCNYDTVSCQKYLGLDDELYGHPDHRGFALLANKLPKWYTRLHSFQQYMRIAMASHPFQLSLLVF